MNFAGELFPRLGWARGARSPALVAILLMFVAPIRAAAQAPGPTGPEDGISGLAIAGARLEPDRSPRDSGFQLFTARVGLRGRVAPGILYHFQGAAGEDLSGVELLDARLELPVDPGLHVSAGQFKAPFSEEALRDKGQLRLLQRSQAVAALAPGRQVGLEVSGQALDQRLTYGTGLFNGEGRTAENPGGGMLWTGRVAFNSVGPAEFYDELVLQAGASVAAASDSGPPPGTLPSVPGPGPAPEPEGFVGDRLALGADAKLTYRGAFLQGEYLWTEFRPERGEPGSGDREVTAEGWYAEAGYSLWGALELLARFDSYRPPGSESRDFLVLGASLWTSFETRLAFQLALQADGPALAPSRTGFPREGIPGGLADGQAIIRLQAGF